MNALKQPLLGSKIAVMILDNIPQQEEKWLVFYESRRGGRAISRRTTALAFVNRDEAVAEVQHLNREEFMRLDALEYRDADGRLIDLAITSDHYFIAHSTDLAEIDWDCSGEAGCA